VRLFNFEISAGTYSDLSQADETISLAFSTHDTHVGTPKIVGFVSFNDDLFESESDEQGHYGFSQNSDSLDASITNSATFTGNLTALPVNEATTGGGNNKIIANVIVVSNR
jgi:hypothetical protein